MPQFKAVTVERLIFTCSRCGCAMSKEDDMMEWQERFIISFRAGYGSVFGDGNYIEGGFCQECIQSVLGQWLRVTDDDPFDAKYKPVSQAEKFLQSYQFAKLLENRVRLDEIAEIVSVGEKVRPKRELLAERLGVPESQVALIAYEYLMRATEPTAEEQITPALTKFPV